MATSACCERPVRFPPLSFSTFQENITTSRQTSSEGHSDIVNIGLHFFLKDVRPMLPPVMNRSIVDA